MYQLILTFHRLHTYTTQLNSTYRILNQRTCKVTSSSFYGTKGSNGQVWAPNPGGRSPITKFNIELKMADKDGPNKKKQDKPTLLWVKHSTLPIFLFSFLIEHDKPKKVLDFVLRTFCYKSFLRLAANSWKKMQYIFAFNFFAPRGHFFAVLEKCHNLPQDKMKPNQSFAILFWSHF